MKSLLSVLLLAACTNAVAQMKVAELPSKSPLVTFRIVFTTGSAADPPEHPGLAYLTAMMLADGGTREMTYKQIVDAMYPMATSVHAQVDKEMTTFSGETHVDNLDAYYKLLRAMLLDPGWRADDFKRVKEDAINFLRVSLRGNNDEELAKEVLYQNIYQGTPYGHYSVGTVSSLEKITLQQVKDFYHQQYTQANLILGLAGGFPPAFLETMKTDFHKLPEGPGFRPRAQNPALIEHTRAVIVDKDTRSVAYSIGFPISVTRPRNEFVPLLVATSYFGQHRMSGGVLYDAMREKRGLNYGDYAYIEYFPRGMFQFEPSPNLARQYQIFQLWIRPVEPPTAKFTLRLALYELNKLVKNGISEEDFERTREFLGKYANVLERTDSAALGYAIDSLYYSIPPYKQYLKTRLASLTRDEVNAAIRRYIRTDKLVIVAVGKDGEELKKELTSSDPSPMTYNSPKPAAITEEDKTVAQWPIGLRAEDVTVVPVGQVFQ
ncbi:MAG TPA: pitrilysin family protein [Bryobacteraceae bacterium]|nr:pitrilysin family protein [Bryobacteraceae bacterium]